MTSNDVLSRSDILAMNRVEKLKFDKLNIKKKNAPTTNRGVLGGLALLSTQDRFSASIAVYRNKHNIFVGVYV